MPAILGKKLGMTQIFTEDGDRIPVTVIQAGPCTVTQVKTSDKDGYSALQIGFGEVKERRMNKPLVGHFKKAGVKPARHLAEIRVELDAAAEWVMPAEEAGKKKAKAEKKVEAGEAATEEAESDVEAAVGETPEGEEIVEAAEAEIVVEVPAGAVQPGHHITVDAFKEGEKVKVSGVSKGKGFAGVIKRHGFAGGPASHGAHFHRAPGSVGASAYPSRVFKGLRLPGQMGNKKSTQRGLTVLKADSENNLLFLKGSVPGSSNSIVFIQTETR